MTTKENNSSETLKTALGKAEKDSTTLNWEHIITAVSKNNNYLASILRFIISPVGFLLIAGGAGYLWYKNRKLKNELAEVNSKLLLARQHVKEMREQMIDYASTESEVEKHTGVEESFIRPIARNRARKPNRVNSINLD